jgi:hypothetical protein
MRNLAISWQNFGRKLGFTGFRGRSTSRANQYRGFRPLNLEQLEDRQLLAITVNTLVDENDGVGVGGISLRDAIAAAAPGDTIDFSVTGTIPLTNGELQIDKALSIDGPGRNLLTIDASSSDPTLILNNGDGSRVFHIRIGADLVSISGVTITGGDELGGGGIYTGASLNLVDCAIVENNSSGSGGGLYINSFAIHINDCWRVDGTRYRALHDK